MDYSKYVFPVNNSNGGSGVLIGSLFITAGHVVEGCSNPSVYINGTSHSLCIHNALFLYSNPNHRSDMCDLAIFKLKGVESPLSFAEYVPTKDKELVSFSHKDISIIENCNYAGVFGSICREEKELVQITGKVIAYYDKYFECEMDEKLCGGRSGSPLFDNSHHLVGILCGDKDHKESSNTVLYLSSKAIKELLFKGATT